MKTYVAKTPHKRPCVLCGDTIIPGDRVSQWSWVNEDFKKKGDGFGGITRVHASCDRIARREELYDDFLTPFEEADEGRCDAAASIPDSGYLLTLEADAALAAARAGKAP